jgi:hypothetical protein
LLEINCDLKVDVLWMKGNGIYIWLVNILASNDTLFTDPYQKSLKQLQPSILPNK